MVQNRQGKVGRQDPHMISLSIGVSSATESRVLVWRVALQDSVAVPLARLLRVSPAFNAEEGHECYRPATHRVCLFVRGIK
jgi:hypothetical protein